MMPKQRDFFLSELTLELACRSCAAVHVFKVAPDGKHQWKLKPAARYADLWSVVAHYKKLKGYESLPAWGQQHKGRALKRAGQIVRFFSMLADPIGVAKECLADIDAKARRGGWNWTLETVVKMAPDWLVEKQKGRRN